MRLRWVVQFINCVCTYYCWWSDYILNVIEYAFDYLKKWAGILSISITEKNQVIENEYDALIRDRAWFTAAITFGRKCSAFVLQCQRWRW